MHQLWYLFAHEILHVLYYHSQQDYSYLLCLQELKYFFESALHRHRNVMLKELFYQNFIYFFWFTK